MSASAAENPELLRLVAMALEQRDAGIEPDLDSL